MTSYDEYQTPLASRYASKFAIALSLITYLTHELVRQGNEVHLHATAASFNMAKALALACRSREGARCHSNHQRSN